MGDLADAIQLNPIIKPPPAKAVVFKNDLLSIDVFTIVMFLIFEVIILK